MSTGTPGRAIRVTALDHIVLNVGEVDRSLRFYRDVLSLEAERVESNAGTASGGTSRRHGVPSDAVLALEVVTGDGHVGTCSADEHPDLFDAVRGYQLVYRSRHDAHRPAPAPRRGPVGPPPGGEVPDDDAVLAGLADDRVRATIGTHDYRTCIDRFTFLEHALRGVGRWESPHHLRRCLPRVRS
ncbi:VOC family protein [Saccharothrix sp. S26]|uniref:VOC family protein n=1 Tax=Saccharothrix sp. S26 TaxID=2907215 RepID=UPI001F409422|nr:VOC family protein [Saccharothrix sp. S26]MCE6998416.1 VOC family protein [Saccharothrix sp. S26]